MSSLFSTTAGSRLPRPVSILALTIALAFFMASNVYAGSPAPKDADKPAAEISLVQPYQVVNPALNSAPSFTEAAPGTGGNPYPMGLAETFSDPTLWDLDDNGTVDMVAGENDGTFLFFDNTGSGASPAFSQVTGASNPLDGEDIGDKSTPVFVDLDGDGDADIVAGRNLGDFKYFENTGSTSAAIYVQRTGAANPLDGFDIGNRSNPAFADLDDDGDPDMLTGDINGTFSYYENTGDDMNPAFTQQVGVNNPMDGEDVGDISAPAFVDIDLDGDYDLVVGETGGTFFYYENQGTKMAPNFVAVTGVGNPLDGFDAGDKSSPAFGHTVTGNGPDLTSGNQNGDFYHYTNGDALPVELSSFSATADGNSASLSWTTASETNNAGFDVQQAVSGGWATVGHVSGAGTTTEAQSYSYTVSGLAPGTHSFRLRQVDFDGTASYSGTASATVGLSGSFHMSAAYPNPYNPQATFTLTIARNQQVSIAAYDLQGRMMSTIYNGELDAQTLHTFSIESAGWASGRYLIRVAGEFFTTSQTVTLLK